MKDLSKLFQNKYIWITIYLLAIGIPFIIGLRSIMLGSFPFWYDPARDFLLALGNIEKLTLIGPTSGIPGIFYGPHWIWLISFGLLFSHDPRVVIFIIQTIPYLLIVPLLLMSMPKLADRKVFVVLWIFFVLSFGLNYGTFPWNPHIAPFLFILLLFLLTKIRSKHLLRSDFLFMGVCGAIAGTLLNVHISFGIGLTVGLIIYLLIDLLVTTINNKGSLRERVMLLICFGIGFGLSLVPFLVFEQRHGFKQVQTIITTLTAGQSVVSVQGLGKFEIIKGFFGRILALFQLPLAAFLGIIGVAIVEIYISIRNKKLSISFEEKKLLLLLFCISTSVLTIYLASKNPVWSYHFIAVEVLFVFISVLILKRTHYAFMIVAIWSVVVLFTQTGTFAKSFWDDPLRVSSLVNKEYIVNLIKNDAKNEPYDIFAYSPSIYIYEYAYLFNYLAEKEVSYDPGSKRSDSDLVYLILPPGSGAATEDFISFRTPEKDYRTTKSWLIPDGTKVLKREIRVR